MFKTSDLYLKNRNATDDIVVNQGGQWSGKTIAIAQALIDKAVSEPDRVITMTAESVPHIERGVLRDVQNIISGSRELQSLIRGYNATRRTYTLYSGSLIEMPVFPDVISAHGPKRDYLFVNELPSMTWEVFEQLMERTRIRTYVDYNPTAPFWCHNKLLRDMRIGTKTVGMIISDHRHNPFLTEAQHAHIEQKNIDYPEWGRVYARGFTGKVEGLVFHNWDTVESLPENASLVGHGVDFGFTNDPTAAVSIYKMDNELYVILRIYERGLTNNKIAEMLLALDIRKCVCDSAEPKSIAEIRAFGILAEPAEKGKDSVNNSIDVLKRYKIHLVRPCGKLVDEFNTYKWRVDKITGSPINEPVDFNNHAIDAIRYVALNKLPRSNSGQYKVM